MKRMVGYVVACMVLLSSGMHTAYAIDAIEPPERLSNSPLLITAYYINNASPGYFELYNSSTEIIDITDASLSLLRSDSDVEEVYVFSETSTYLPGKSYAVVSFNDTVPNASIQVTDLGSHEQPITQMMVSLERYKPYSKVFNGIQTQRMALGETSTGYTTTGNYSVDTRQSIYDSGLYIPQAEDFPLSPVEVLANPKQCAPTDESIECREYVKFYNDTNGAVDFTGIRLRIGYQGQSVSSTNAIPLSGVVQPGEYAVFSTTADNAPLSITNSGGFVWLEDMYGLVQYPSSVVSYADASADTKKGLSWALLDGLWQWAVPNPAGENRALIIQSSLQNESDSLTPCRSDQYRSPETNRCRLIETDTVSPCDPGQYRNPETGRCRNVTSSSSSLRPCDADEYRNPETNRCRSIATQASSLTPCASGWERNPDTNRCRKVTSSLGTVADFPIIPYESSQSSTYGWYAFVGVALLALLYGLWEWRHEASNLVERLRAKTMR